MSGSQTSGSAVHVFKELFHPKPLNPSLNMYSIHENFFQCLLSIFHLILVNLHVKFFQPTLSLWVCLNIAYFVETENLLLKVL